MSSDWKYWLNSKLDQIDGSLADAVPGYETAKKMALNTVSLGGHSALERSKQQYLQEWEAYQSEARSFQQARAEIQTATEMLGLNVSTGVESLRMAQDLVQRLSYSRVSASGLDNQVLVRLWDMRSAEKFVRDFNAAQDAGVGAGTGFAVTAGAWFLVAHLGVASTGTAIGTLSGAAAYSATLAWFGGSAVAAGGGGMVLGGVILSSVAVLPMFAFVAFRSYSGAKEWDKATEQLADRRKANKEGTAKMRTLLPQVVRAAQEIKESTARFDRDVEDVKARAFTLAVDLSSQVFKFVQELSSLQHLDGL